MLQISISAVVILLSRTLWSSGLAYALARPSQMCWEQLWYKTTAVELSFLQLYAGAVLHYVTLDGAACRGSSGVALAALKTASRTYSVLVLSVRLQP